MDRRKSSRGFKLEAVNLVRERDVSIVQAASDLDINYNILRRWIKELGADPKHAFPGPRQMKPERPEIHSRNMGFTLKLLISVDGELIM